MMCLMISDGLRNITEDLVPQAITTVQVMRTAVKFTHSFMTLSSGAQVGGRQSLI